MIIPISRVVSGIVEGVVGMAVVLVSRINCIWYTCASDSRENDDALILSLFLKYKYFSFLISVVSKLICVLVKLSYRKYFHRSYKVLIIIP